MPSGRIAGVRYVLPRHKAANWVGPGRGRRSTRPGANGVVELSPFDFLDRLADLVPPPRKHRHRYHGVFAPNHKLRPAVTTLAKRQRRQAARRRCRRACGQYACRGRLLRREPRDAQATLARHVTDCLGETDCAGGGVSARVPELRRRHPAEGGRPAGAGLLRTGGSQAGEGQDGFVRVKSAPDTPRRTTRAASRLSRSWPARRLGRLRADP